MDSSIQIIEQIHLASQLLEKVGDRIFSPYGLTIRTHQLLKLVESGVNTTSTLADHMNLTKAGVTQKVKPLEQKGYVVREASAEDMRVWNFSLTDSGKDALKRIAGPYSASAETLFENLSEAEADHLAHGLRCITYHLSMIRSEELAAFAAQLQKQSTKG